MEFFANDDSLARLEAQLKASEGAARLPLLVELAWAVRQRDCARALVLADAAESMLAAGVTANVTAAVTADITADITAGVKAGASDSTTVVGLSSRLLLVRAEVKWLFGELADGLTLAKQALHGFTGLASDGGRQGCADAHWLLSWITRDQGNAEGAEAEMQAAMQAAPQSDPTRFTIAQAALAGYSAFRDIIVAQERWGEHFAKLQAISAKPLNPPDPSRPPLPAAALCWVANFLGIAADQNGDQVGKIGYFGQSYTQALASGQIRRAIVAAINIGDGFNYLNDCHTALDWMQRALVLARKTGWPGTIGIALQQTAESMRRLQQHDNAHDLLREALRLLAGMAGSRNYAVTLLYLGDVELARGRYASALETFQLLEQRALALAQADLQCVAKRGQAQALLEQGQAEAALSAASAALARAGSNTDDQITALQVLAEIHNRHALPAPAQAQASNVPMYYLEQAFTLAQGITDYTVPGDLFDALAEQYARHGDYQRAWQLGQQAALAREKIYRRDTTNRALAMQLSHQADREQVEDAHRRELASEAKRAEILQQTSDTLAHLGAIGQEITAHLDAAHVFEALLHHIHDLFDVSHFAVYLMAEDGLALDGVFIHDHGRQLPATKVPLNHPSSHVARCARERRPILILSDPQRDSPQNWVSGAEPTRSSLFGPLMLADQVLGVMTVQSTRADAIVYRTREELIFNALCAYTTIALSNAKAHQNLASAHRQLQDTQQQLILQGKMAGLGSLTAGVAHEINNPTNFVHVAAQNQRADIAEFQQFVASLIEADEDAAILQGFADRFARLEHNVATMLNGTQRIKGIVKDLRSFTRMDSEKKRPVRLSACLISTLNLVRTSWLEQVEFITELAPDPEIECWPALLNQVFMNLLVNGCQAIVERLAQQAKSGDTAPGPTGKLWLRLFRQGPVMVLEFQDNGIGMDGATQTRIMEPFFTTKEVGQGTGLGLSIAFDIIQKHGGSIKVDSQPGHGSCFTIVLPLA